MNTDREKDIFIINVLTIVVVASGADLVADLSQGVETSHLLGEFVLVSISITSVLWLLLGIRKQRLDILALKEELMLTLPNRLIKKSFLYD